MPAIDIDKVAQLKRIKDILEFNYILKAYKELWQAGIIPNDEYYKMIINSLFNMGRIDNHYRQELLTKI